MDTQTNQYDVYVKFLLECKDILGDVDLEKLANDEEYKADFYNLISLSSDHLANESLFYIQNYEQDLDAEFQASLTESTH